MMELTGVVVIVGWGAAGHGAAQSLRGEGFEGRIVVVDPVGTAINRTLVDTGILPGLLAGNQIGLPAVRDVEFVSARAEGLREDGAVVLDDGRELRGDALVLACGSAPRRLGPDIEVDPVVRLHSLYGVDDAERLRRAIPEPAGARVVVLGGGFIGTEVASYYSGAGADVVLVARSELPLKGAVGSEVAARLAALHRSRVDARLGVRIRAVRGADAPGSGERGDGTVQIELDGGQVVSGDAVVVALGSEPATVWAGFSGGIPTDDRLRVGGMPGVYAAGSAAMPTTGAGRVRVDHWDAAVAQGSHVAKVVLHDLGIGVDPGPYAPTSGFTLMAYGAVIAARGVRGDDAGEEHSELEKGGVITEFAGTDGGLTGLAGWNAGAAVAQGAAALR